MVAVFVPDIDSRWQALKERKPLYTMPLSAETALAVPMESSEGVSEWLREAQDRLTECIQAGRALTDLFDRDYLQYIAREIADDIYKLSNSYPASIIANPVVQEAVMPKIVKAKHNLPTRHPYFRGQEKTLGQIREALDTHSYCVLVVSGLGGVGKTQLALEYAYRNKDRTESNQGYAVVCWVQADSPSLLEQSFSQLVDCIGINMPQTLQEQQDVVKAWFNENTEWLLIFDNVEDMNAVRGFIPKTESGHIIITTRQQVSDPSITPINLLPLLPKDASQFLIDRVHRSKIEEGERECAEKLAKKLGYLPLALEQAGAYIDNLQSRFCDYLKTFETSPIFLLSKPDANNDTFIDSPTDVVTKTWKVHFEKIKEYPASYDLLNYSTFLAPDDIPIELFSQGASLLGENIATALADIEKNPLLLDNVLQPLVQFSLIQRHPDKNTFSIHRLVQIVLNDDLTPEQEERYLFNLVRAMDRVFPTPYTTPEKITCRRLIHHVKEIAKIIRKKHVMIPEAGTLLAEAGYYLRDISKLDDANDLALFAYDLHKHKYPDTPWHAKSSNRLGELRRSQGKFEEARRLTKEAMDILKNSADHKQDYIFCLKNLSMIHNEKGEYKEAAQIATKIIHTLQKMTEFDPEDTVQLQHLARAYHNSGTIHRKLGEWLEAEEAFLEAKRIFTNIVGPNEDSVARTLTSLGALYRDQGHYAKGEATLNEAISIYRSFPEYDCNDVGLATAQSRLATIYRLKGEYALALETYKASLLTQREKHGQNSPKLAGIYFSIGECYRKIAKSQEHPAKMYERAELYYKRALQLNKTLNGEDYVENAWSWTGLGSLYRDTGKFEKAKDLFEKALRVRERALGKRHPHTAITLKSYAKLYVLQGDEERAESLATQAAEIDAIAQRNGGSRMPEDPDDIAPLNLPDVEDMLSI